MPADTASSLRLEPHFEKLLRCANIGVVDGLSCEKKKKKKKRGGRRMYDEQCKVSNANVEMAGLSSSSSVKPTERTGLPKLIASASQRVIDAATCTGQPYHRLIIIQMICGNQRHKTAQSDVSLLYPPLYLPVQNCLCVPYTLVCRTHTFRHTEREHHGH